jgi:nickel-dependent lactate racemase
MMLTVPYGGRSVDIDFGGADVRVIRAAAAEDVDESGTIHNALASPARAQDLPRFLEGADDVIVIVNDAKRPTPTARVLKHMSTGLRTVQRITYLVATGTHRAPTRDEIARILGDTAHSGARVAVHDAKDSSAVCHLGRTSRGTDVSISRAVTEASRIVVIGSVEPHYFAGFTGGRKAFLPGVAAYETVRQNHSHALHPGSQLMALAGNPVHEDMMDALGFMDDRRIFAVMTVLDASHRICGAFAGDIRATFELAVDRARSVYSVPVERKADIVVAIAESPSDTDLYQAHKAIESGKLALAEGGILILVAACPEGLGNDAFVRQLSSSNRPEDVAHDVGLEYRLGDHKAVKLAELLTRSDVWAVTQLSEDTVRSIFFRPFSDLQTALDGALRTRGRQAAVLVVADAAVTVPSLP